jgi:hypothetical protein
MEEDSYQVRVALGPIEPGVRPGRGSAFFRKAFLLIPQGYLIESAAYNAAHATTSGAMSGMWKNSDADA